ncbi:MAG: xylose isomerase [Eubacteriales bacterium]|nr:xylose isomerase [Eubacteriales bacterium]MDD3866998.1 xylose isomerase [Eubacteriales bacterium]MDD4461337.1 xylose isomerase [Eubacteriales bacterium]
MKEFYPNVPTITYEGSKTSNMLAFRYYNPDEVIAGKTMREHLRFAMSYWHTMVAEGTDMFGVGTVDKSYGAHDPMEQARNKVHASFELMNKLGLDFYCFHDRDIAPEADHLAETNRRLDEITDLMLEQQKKYNKKVLWGTANLFTNPRYRHGAGTACSADVFAFAAAQVKKALELTVKLGGEGYVFWGGREGYETLLNTDMKLERDNLARLMRMAVDYGRSIGFTGDFYVEPKPKEPMKHQYDFDAATVISFLQAYGLDKDFKLNIEANHATLAGHTFQHELRLARDTGFFGSVDANQGDLLLGWDTDQFPTDVYEATWCMYEILKAGGFTHGGLNFDAKARRASSTLEDVFISYIVGMDTFALGLRLADRIISDGRIDQFVADRYASYQDGIGKKIVDGTISMADLEAYALEKGEVQTGTGRQEYLEGMINSLLFG